MRFELNCEQNQTLAQTYKTIISLPMSLPEEDDFVEVSKDAPIQFSPGSRGVVVSVAQCLSEVTERATGTPIGRYVIWVGIVDNGSVQAKVIPGKWLSVIDDIY